MPVYEFMCEKCEHVSEELFSMSSYPDHVDEDGYLLHGKCKECGHDRLFRHIRTAPEISTGYMSMEKYWAQNPGLVRKHEDKLAAKLEERHRKRVMDNIDKQQRRNDAHKRHDGYGKGKGEERLKYD